ncbi:hypothetical protein EDD37DRAFT_680349 [Exophiala viscosa]|uniref:uncharacterized protein n=1 Tax=Exophiala viscosa TaxID=2486360 RepID=UPI0021A0BD20|nr:hypothetical protein EDD37DRAFT_680349 [Exophiala viscosa]
MRSLTFLNVAFVCFSFTLPSVDAKCCNHLTKTLECGDGTLGTPCCGYGRCNAFCCRCPGVSIFEDTVEYNGTEYQTIVTAPSDPVKGQASWTCRDRHITTTGPPPTTTATTVTSPTGDGKRSAGDAAVTDFLIRTTAAPLPTGPATFGPKSSLSYLFPSVDLYPSSPEDHDAWADEVRVFEDLSGGLQINGTWVVSKEQYLGFFGVSDLEIGSEHGQNVLAKFAMHDINRDGYLNFEETALHCDRHGCYGEYLDAYRPHRG